MNEVNPIVLTDKDTNEKYTLEFSRESVKFAEQRGFDIGDVERFPMTKIPELFFYAFRMHHRNIARDKTDKMYFDDLKGLPDGALKRLGELYAAPFSSLSHDETEEDEKNSRMTVEF